MIKVRGFVSHAFDDGLYEGGRSAFKMAVTALVDSACEDFKSDTAGVEAELFFEAKGYGRPLMSEVRRQIRESHFLIADISQAADGKGPFNPNVLYEIGYAMALNKEVLVMRRRAETPPPTDIADLLYGSYDRLEELPGTFRDRMIHMILQALKITRDNDRHASLFENVWFPLGTQRIDLVCSPEPVQSPYSNAREANFIEFDKYEDRDALLALSLFFARVYPEATIVRHLCGEIPSDALGGNLVVLGGPGCVEGEGNSVSRDLMLRRRSHVRYPEDGEGLLWGDDPVRPTLHDKHGGVIEDWGSILATQNPHNESSRIILLHGTLTFGTLAAATALIDTPAAMRNHLAIEAMDLVDRFAGAAQFEALVKAEVGSGNRILPPKIDPALIRRVS